MATPGETLDYPDGTGSLYAAEAEYQRDNRDDLFSKRMGSWSLLLLTQAFEVLAEEDVGLLRTRLLELSGFCTTWMDALDRRVSAPTDQG